MHWHTWGSRAMIGMNYTASMCLEVNSRWKGVLIQPIKALLMDSSLVGSTILADMSTNYQSVCCHINTQAPLYTNVRDAKAYKQFL